MIRFALPFAARLAVAQPNLRSSHDHPTPQAGGLFLMVSILVSGAIAAVFQPAWREQLFIILLPSIILSGIGWLDDRCSLPVGLRLIAFAGISCVVANFHAGSIPFVIAACALLVLINVTNFMDGIDGLVVSEYVPMLLLFGLLAALGAFGDVMGLLALALAGALLGFFLYNRPKAQIFLGDSGSLVVGLLAGACLLEFAKQHGPIFALVLPLYFLMDAGITLSRRVLRGERFWEAHRQHFYQRAYDSGQSNWSILARVGIFNLVLCVLVFYFLDASPVSVALICGAAIAMVAILLWTLLRRHKSVPGILADV